MTEEDIRTYAVGLLSEYLQAGTWFKRLCSHYGARALAAGLQEANKAAREQATAARAAAMANGASSAASSSASSSGTNGSQLGMPTSSTSSSGTSGSTGSRQSSSQMAGAQFSPLTSHEMELREIQPVERLRRKLEQDLKDAIDRENAMKTRAARLETLEADKAELECLDESALTDPVKVLKKNMMSLHAHVDSKLDFMQSTLDQFLDALTRPGFRPPAQSLLPLSAMSDPFPVQAGTQPSGERKDEELNTWLRTVPVWVKAKRTLLEDEVVTATSYLEGKAAKWLDGVVIKAGYGRRMADWAKSLTLDQFMEMVEAGWHNPQAAQRASDAINKLDQRKFKSVRELTITVESLILVPGINYSDQFLLTTFVRCLPENIRNLLASEARTEYHSFETLCRKALDLEATLGNAQPTSGNDSKKKKSPQEWKKKRAKLMMVESNGTQTEIDELSDLMDHTEYDGEEVAEGSTLAAAVKTKAAGRGKGQPRGQGKTASNQTKQAEWVKASLDQDVWRDRRTRGLYQLRGIRTLADRVRHLSRPVASILANKERMIVMDYIKDVVCTFSYGGGELNHKISFLVSDDLPFDMLLGMYYLKVVEPQFDWDKKVLKHKLPNGRTVRLTKFKASSIVDTYGCLCASAFYNYYKQNQEEGMYLVYVSEKGEAGKTPPEIERVVAKFPDLFEEPTRVVEREVVHTIEIIPGMLAQQDGKKLRPIEYTSKKMPSKKLAKSTYERELYALYKALVHWRHFLLGRFFYLRTDHQTLKWIKTQPTLSDALKRWIEVIDQYDFKLEYNKVVDALSRRADNLGALVSDFGVSNEVTQSLVGAYQEDTVTMNIIRKLQAKDKATERLSVSMDFMDTLVTSKSGKRHIFVIIDRFTKYARLVPMPETARREYVIKLFKDNWVRDFGLPKTIISDRDVRFTSELWKKTAEQMGSQLQMTPGNHPEANGQAEQMIRVVQHLLRHYIKASQDDWDEQLPLIASLYNNAIHSSTGISPNQLHLGWKPRSALDFLLPENRPAATPGTLEYGVQYEKLLQEAVEHMKKAQQAMIASENQHRRQSTFQVGERVWVKASELGQEFGISHKLMPQYFGPWEVLDVVGDESDGPTYVIRVPGHLRTHPVFHALKLAPLDETDQFPSRRSMLPPTMDGQVDIDDIVDHRDMPVAKSLGRGRPPKPKREYHVRFRHHKDPNEDRWFTKEELIETAPQVVVEYERKLKGKAPAKVDSESAKKAKPSAPPQGELLLSLPPASALQVSKQASATGKEKTTGGSKKGGARASCGTDRKITSFFAKPR
ncbi:hypothetical protein CBR_g23988 [Chara braunii]|uniref:Integrase catalytic domain-containing protein n=1 Tax=Chara braunii TaxID=69332 RepID=A0A388L5Q9_CHABU|nr:hypothetical protein CBR_g23988 [Chara braunii]|eukprot:GBG77543.1 hypothetical protein CBR_g23988 [Chara braunii]